MHKKLEAELMSLAHQILQLKNKEDVNVLKQKAKEVYEKLSVLSFIEEYFLITPNPTENKAELLAKMEGNEEIPSIEKLKAEISSATNEIEDLKSDNEIMVSKEETKPIVDKVSAIEKKTEIKEVIESKPLENVEEKEKIETQTNTTLMEEASKIAQKINAIKEKPSIKNLAEIEEFKDTIPADVTANLFEKAPVKPEDKKVSTPIATKQSTPKTTVSDTKTSLNDRLLNQKIQIGLNDRIAFVKHLFNFSQEDFNRVLSQLNTFETEQSAKDFITHQVKPEYDWSSKEEYEERLFALIERRFL